MKVLLYNLHRELEPGPVALDAGNLWNFVTSGRAICIQGRPENLKNKPRQRNLWVGDAFEWRPKARLAQSANPAPDSAASALCIRSPVPFSSQFASPVNATPLRRIYVVAKRILHLRISTKERIVYE
jgi:hypothetical protein